MGGAVTTHPVVFEAPRPGQSTSLLEIEQAFSGETVVPDGGNAALDPCVPRRTDPRGLGKKAAGLYVFAKATVEVGTERVGLIHDRLGVIDVLCPHPLCGQRRGRR